MVSGADYIVGYRGVDMCALHAYDVLEKKRRHARRNTLEMYDTVSSRSGR